MYGLQDTHERQRVCLNMFEITFEFEGNTLLGKLQAQDASPTQQMNPLWALEERITSRFSAIQIQELPAASLATQLPFRHK